MQEESNHEELKEKISFLERLVNTTRDVIYALDIDGNIEYLNDAWNRVTGYSKSEWLGKSFAGLLHPEDLQYIQGQFENVVYSKMQRTVEGRYKHKSGLYRLGEYTITPELDNDEVVSVVGIARDITERKQTENAARKSGEILETVTRNIEEVIYVMPSDYASVVYVSPGIQNLYGVSQEDLSGDPMSWTRYINPDDMQRITSDLKQQEDNAIEGHQSQEFRVNHPERGEIWVSSLVYPVEAKTGNVVGISTDITERKCAENALRQSEKRFQEVAENSREFIWEVDVNGLYTYASPVAGEVFGYTPDEIVGKKHFFDFFHHEDREALRQAAFEVFAKKEAFLGFVNRNVDVNGNTVWLSTSGVPLLNGEGELLGYRGADVDITERKEAESRLSQVQRIARIGSWEWDLKNETLSWSDEMYTILGKDRATYSPTAEDFSRFVHEDDMDVLDPDEMQRHLAKGSYTVEYRVFHQQTGDLRHVRVWGSVTKDESGEPAIVTGTLQDISEYKQAETERLKLEGQLQQALKMEAIGTLAGGIAHDFNNILGIIMGSTQLSLDNTPDGDETHEFLTEALKATNRAKDLVKQILTFSRQSKQDEHPLALGIIVKEALKMLRASLPVTIEIQRDISGDVGLIMADPTQMHQVIINLSTNAAHAMRKNGGILRVEVKNVSVDEEAARQGKDLRPGSYVKLAVSDTGHGIEPEDMERIFEPYFTTKNVGEGTGLGLSVVQGIVVNHDGIMDVSSEPGKGTTFELLFPKLDMAVDPTEVDETETYPTGTERVLFVDDEPGMTRTYKAMLERLGYTVSVRTSSIEALDPFKAEPDGYDVVITDQTMPHLTGQVLAQEIMAIRPEMPIILCTGHSDTVNETKAAELGAKAFVMKPISMGDIARTIREVLDEDTDPDQH